jgi:hypothetical protein
MRLQARTLLHVCCLGGFLIGSALSCADKKAPEDHKAPEDPAVSNQPRDRSVILRGKGSPPVQPESDNAPAAEKRYWADPSTNTIRRANVDGSDVEVLVSGLNGPYGISYDQSTQELLWTSSGDEKVQSLRLGGSVPTNLETSFEDNFAVSLMERDRQVAYAVLEGAIVRMSQDRQTGVEQREVLVQLQEPAAVRGLALSADGRALYLGDSVGRMARKLRLTDRKLVSLTFIDEVPAPPPELLEEVGP